MYMVDKWIEEYAIVYFGSAKVTVMIVSRMVGEDEDLTVAKFASLDACVVYPLLSV